MAGQKFLSRYLLVIVLNDWEKREKNITADLRMAKSVFSLISQSEKSKEDKIIKKKNTLESAKIRLMLSFGRPII